MERLINAGADLTVLNKQKRTVLHKGAVFGACVFLLTLIKRDSNLKIDILDKVLLRFSQLLRVALIRFMVRLERHP
jgi:hypothetical protein